MTWTCKRAIGLLAALALLAAPALVEAQQAKSARKHLAPGFEVDEALLAAAKKEGRLVWWAPIREHEAAKTAAKFEELTGVKVEFTRLSTGPQLTRLTQERSARLHTVDVIGHGDLGVWESVYKAKKWLVPYLPEGAKKYAPEFNDKDGYYSTLFILAIPIAYNTRLIKGGDVPKRYTDLLDPRYRGKIAMPHAKHSGGFNEFVMILSGMKTLGWDYFKKLKQNNVLVVMGSQFNLNPIVANGERAIALAPVESSFVDDKNAGKPVDVAYPEEGTVISLVVSGLVADAPHPSAGKLFLEWLSSQPCQTLLASWSLLVPHPEAAYPAGRKKLSDIKPLLSVAPAEAAKKAVEIKETFSDLFGG